MDIAIISDTHGQNPTLNLSGVDVLVAAGDISDNLEEAFRYLKESSSGVPTLWVPGNHECYGRTIVETAKEMRAICRKSNVKVLSRSSAEINGVAFHGVTLWSDFMFLGASKQSEVEKACAETIPDFKKIRGALGGGLTTVEVKKEHQKDLKWLHKKLRIDSATPQVVITHFPPSARAIDSRIPTSEITPYYVNQCDSLVEAADLVVFGHCHRSFEFYLGRKEKTLAISNPQGFLREMKKSMTTEKDWQQIKKRFPEIGNQEEYTYKENPKFEAPLVLSLAI